MEKPETIEQRRPLSRPLRLDEIKDYLSGEIEATAAEREAIAALLDLPELRSLKLVYRLRRGGGGRYHLTGRLTADVTQIGVVSLDPLPATVDVPIEVEFWPRRLLDELQARAEESEPDPLFEWPEPIAEGKIDLGPLIYETFATALDPYPKREGAQLDWADEASKERGETPTSPFAALEQLKRR
ncbi:MAG: YceD family protein [Methyloceanibacter sp.]|uniref:YceD family protein n=1 Tax=Methyloceanibacter sp. TaxID=1965321 RepID=UPI003D9AE259